MNTQDTANQRRAQRKRAPFSAVVTDVISGKPLGQLGNLSTTGLLMICSQAPRSEALYQVSLPLPESGLGIDASTPIELGIQEQWQETTAGSSQIWAGYRIVAISDVDATRLDHWLGKP